MYEAADTYTNMEVRFEPYRQQFVDLRTDAHIEVKGKKALCVFLFGECEFLTKFVGHYRPNAVYRVCGEM